MVYKFLHIDDHNGEGKELFSITDAKYNEAIATINHSSNQNEVLHAICEFVPDEAADVYRKRLNLEPLPKRR